MPFPRNWLEELVAEYLQLEDYSVETGHPVQIGKRGGRRELDILGSKICSGKQYLIHIETGRARSEKKLNEKIEDQFFGSDISEELTRKFGTDKCDRWFISDAYGEDSKVWQRLRSHFSQKGVTLVTFKELMEKIEKAIEDWKMKNKTKKQKPPTLPENLWMLKMLERIREAKLTE